jgi:hypothetical protein
MIWLYESLGAAVTVVIGIVIVAFADFHDRDWYPHGSGPVMRRHVNGKMETRPMTPREKEKYLTSSIRW